jgi:hypothetical protein
MSNDVDALYAMFHVVLDLSQPALRLEQLGLDSGQIDALTARHKEQAIRRPSISFGVASDQYSWYAGPRPDDVYWPAMIRQFQSARTRPAWMVQLDDASSRIVSRLRHPKEPSFATRGLVVTYPQSGATTNIGAVIAKAADRGYRLFIVLAGPHNAMRQQTQARLTHQLVHSHPTGWQQLTTSPQDFRPLPISLGHMLNAAAAPVSVLAVVKKNARVLRHLIDWLHKSSGSLHEFPALIIDTDSDLPSATSTSLIPRVSQLLSLLPRAAYLGYTSTPLANLLLEPGADDLFPRDFITALPRPSRYTGPEVLFGSPLRGSGEPDGAEDGYDMIRSIAEEDAFQLRPTSRARMESFVPQLPDSLRQAVEYFWMAAAARRVRGESGYRNTMLIHTSANATVRTSFLTPLEALRAHTIQELAFPKLLARLRQAWQEEVHRVPAADFDQLPVTFDQLLPYLSSVVQECRVLTDNTSSSDHFSDQAGQPTAIVVGGTSFARELTLEGFLVGYFVPATSLYDTLQQMNHWFGFHTRYEDLRRIWLTTQLASWWREVVDVDIELRSQLTEASQGDVSPHHLALGLRSHPKLRLPKAAKQGQFLPLVSYGGRRVQTRYFHTDASWLRPNLAAARTLVAASADQASQVHGEADLGRYIFFNVPAQLIIDFLTQYQFHERSPDVDSLLLIDYIEKRITRAHSLTHWNVAVIGKPSEARDDTLTLAEGINVGRVIRSRLATAADDKDAAAGTADIKILMSRRDAAVDLPGDINHLNENEIRQARRTHFPRTGLLALYPIDKISASPLARPTRAPLNAEEHVIGVGLVFPEPATPDSTV